MPDELLPYYNRELDFLRRMSVEFALRHPEAAGRLQLGPNVSPDPHVERLLEGFALIAGRIQLKLDDQFPEISLALLSVLYPHYLAPVPAMSIVQFVQPPGRSNLTTGQVVECGTRLQSQYVQSARCWFRTSYPAVLWPIEVEAAELRSDNPPDASTRRWAEAAIRIRLKCSQQTPLAQIKFGDAEQARPIESLRFFINGERSLTYPLYELIFNHATRVELRPVGDAARVNGVTPKLSPIHLPASCLRPVGFGADEGMLPYTGRSFIGYRLLTEYFTFPEKFLFFDVTGLDRAVAAGFGNQFEIWIHLKDVAKPDSNVHRDTFLLGCTPIVNLFDKTTEPIQLSHEKTAYRVVPDLKKQASTEVYSVDEVEVIGADVTQARRFQPFYALSHTFGSKPDEAFWYALRSPSTREEVDGTDVSLMFVDRHFNPCGVSKQRAIVRTTCTNRDLPRLLPVEGELTIMGPLAMWRARCIQQPCQAVWPALQRGAHWRLLSHLTLNYLSLKDVERDEAPEALREILRLYDFSEPRSERSQAINRQIDGITTLRSEPAIGRLPNGPIGAGYVRGLRTTIKFDERQYSGGSIFLFAAVLERFLGLYVSVNSFNQLVAENRQGKLKQWDPRTGEQTLL